MKQVTLLGFGGPETPKDVRPFLDRIVAGRPIPPQRYEQVVDHYRVIGGASPFNELTRRQANALQAELEARGAALPVSVAYRFSEPFIADAARAANARGDEIIAVILAAHQSGTSWDKYVELFPRARFTQPFYDKPGFVQANAARIHDALTALGRSDFSQTTLIFTAHSIPQAMAHRSGYEAQLQRSAQLAARAAGATAYEIAYTSRSGPPAEPWLEPDVRDLLPVLSARGVREVLVDPIGFLCDHVEVLYDLDIGAAAVANRLNMRLSRARALNDHPTFIGALADAVQACLG
ncbi:MAG: ferrochelatase [Candidatus Baltobacteraceae bacterium]